MTKTKTFYYASNDVMFKRIFGDAQDTGPLVDFLRATLDLPHDDYAEITIADSHLVREHPDDKLGILDVKVKTASGKLIDIEIQLCDHVALRERILFYLAKMITEQIGSGSNYWDIQRSICIFITDFVLVPESTIYHNRYTLRDATGAEFTKLAEIVTQELAKLPDHEDGNPCWVWLKFLKCRTQEELKMLTEKDSGVKKAAAKLMKLNADEQARMAAESREKLRMDIACYKRDAERQGLEKGLATGLAKGRAETSLAIARNLLGLGRPAEEIAQATGLSLQEIQSLMH